MRCIRCDCVVPLDTVSYDNIAGNIINCLNCPTCSLCVGLKIQNCWLELDEVLIDVEKVNGWHQVKHYKDQIIHYVLSQIIYRQYEVPNHDRNECEFAPPDPGDIVSLLWYDQQPVGFYTVKPKGMTIEGKLDFYRMATLDTAYIRKEFRGKGFGFEIIKDITTKYTHQDIGFSTPIATPMLRVLFKFLLKYPEYRYKLWEITGTGSEGNKKLIWFAVSKFKTNRKIGPSL